MKTFLLRMALLIALAIALPLFLFHEVFFNNIIVLGDLSGSDLLNLHLPFKYILHTNLLAGQLPLWEPNLAMGFPVFAEGQTGVFYPINLILAFISPYLSLNLSIIAVFFISFISSFLYLKSLKRSTPASIFGSIAFSFSAFFITRFKHLNLVNVASLFPLLFLFTRLYFDRKKMRYVLLTGFTIAAMVFAGHPQMMFYCVLVFLIYTLFEAFRIFYNGKDQAVAASVVFFLTVSIVTGVGLSAVQTLPTVEFLQLTQRQDFNDVTLTAYPYNPRNLITLISPYFFGNPALGTYKEDENVMGIFWENASYFGVIPLLFALFWIYKAVRKKGSFDDFFFIFLALFSLLLMFGKNTPLFLALTKIIPLFNLFRFPTRFNLFFIFALVALSTNTFDYLLNRLPAKRKKIFTFGTILLLIADLFVFATPYISYLHLEEYRKVPEIVKKISTDKNFFRIYSLTQYGQSPYAVFGWKNDAATLLATGEMLPPNNNVFYKLPSFTDRGWFEGGLSLQRRNRVENFLLKENQNPALTGKILGLYNVKYLISFADQLGIEITKIGEYNLGPAYASPVNIFENMQVMPRVYFVPEAEVAQNKEEAFQKITDPNFLPTKTVILEKMPQTLPPRFNEVIDTFQHDNPVRIIDYQPQEVLISANLKNSGFLVFSDIYYPGWKAEVDGKSQEILRANYLNRALELTPGQHQIRFDYDPVSFKIGFAISAVTFLGLIVVGGWLLVSKRR